MLEILKNTLKLPSSVRDLIPVRKVFPDGMFLDGTRYSKTWAFSDINYITASEEDKKKFFAAYCSLLNSLDSETEAKITVMNRNVSEEEIERDILMKEQKDGLDGYRCEYNRMIREKLDGSAGRIQQRYLTVSAAAGSPEEARACFLRTGTELSSYFTRLGSRLRDLSLSERLAIIAGFCRKDRNLRMSSLQEAMRAGTDIADTVCPGGARILDDRIELGSRLCRVMFLRDYASYLSDSFLSDLYGAADDITLSLDIVPVSTEEAVKKAELRLLGAETNIAGWQRRQNSSRNYSAEIPYDLELQRKEAKEFLNDISARDQRMMLASLTIAFTADTPKQLELITENIRACGRKHMCGIDVLRFQQYEGFATVLPFGVRRTDVLRTLTTESLAVFIPFRIREIHDEGGICFGENAVSENLILCNRASLMNQSCFFLGVPGSGKSFCAKELISFLMLNTDDDILICDPEGEYTSLVSAMGDTGSVIEITAGGKDHINAMEISEGYGGNEPSVTKSQFIMSLVEQINTGILGPGERSVIDRCTGQVLQEAKKKGTVPTLGDLRQCLIKQPEAAASEIALALELYTSGSLDIFGSETNVDLDRRVLSFDIHRLGRQLKKTGLLIITDTMLNRVNRNWRKGRRTHLFIDEFHVLFENENSAAFFTSAWRQFRKRNAFPTAMTQNVEYLLDSVQASTMLSNSECVIMFNQAAQDREKLTKLLGISPAEEDFITNSETGCGLIKYGDSIVPFRNRFPKDSALYRLMTTKSEETEFVRCHP